MALAEDRRARGVGDTLTIRLVERLQAEKSAAQDGKRNSSFSSRPNSSLEPKDGFPLPFLRIIDSISVSLRALSPSTSCLVQSSSNLDSTKLPSAS